MDRVPGHSRESSCQSRQHLLLAFLAIFLGGTLYVFIRPTPGFFFDWLTLIGLRDSLEALRQHSLSLTPLLPDWVVYSLPQGLWAFAYALIITGIWGWHRSASALFWLATIPLLVFGFEGLQYAGVIKGTYCIEDMLWGLAGIFSGVIIAVRHQTKYAGYRHSTNE